MSIGNMNIGAIYIGNKEITDIYKGSELLYTNTPPIVTLSVSLNSSYLFGISATLTSNEKVDLTGKSKYKWNQSASAIGTDSSLYTDGNITSTSQSLLKAGSSGNNYLHVLASNAAGTKKIEYISNAINISSLKKEYAYSGSVENTTLLPGQYQLQCWGAQGGSYTTSDSVGGKGGYSTGILTITDPTIIYITAGGQGTIVAGGTATGGYNGGGSAYSSSSSYKSISGGGGSDIRIGHNSLYSRVIVAGGGGGGCGYGANSTYYRKNGGAGGGASGDAGEYYSSSYLSGKGGSQTSGGNSYYGTTVNSTSYGTNSTFGQGGSNSSSYGYGAGGGGWYGGGYGRRAAGGGGSGYVYTDSTASNYPSGCLLNSSYYLSDASTVAGSTSFTSPAGSTETGHEGNGYIIITKVS